MKKIYLSLLALLIVFIFWNIPIPPSQVTLSDEYIIKNEEMASEMAEDILYSNYGRLKIFLEKPFVVELVNDSIWYLHGTSYTSRFRSGGVFHIKISARDARIIDMYHDK